MISSPSEDESEFFKWENYGPLKYSVGVNHYNLKDKTPKSHDSVSISILIQYQGYRNMTSACIYVYSLGLRKSTAVLKNVIRTLIVVEKMIIVETLVISHCFVYELPT